MRAEWIKVSLRVIDRKENIVEMRCPNCKKKMLDYAYVGDKNTRIGYFQIWCNDCLKGIYISRVVAPVNAKFFDFETILENKIPNIEYIDK